MTNGRTARFQNFYRNIVHSSGYFDIQIWTGMIMLDLQIAFDTVWSQNSMSEIKCYGSGFCWMVPFLFIM